MPKKQKKQEMGPLTKEFDALITDAPLDFMGTGSKDSAAQEEKWFNAAVDSFRQKLIELEKTVDFLRENVDA